MLGGTVTLEHVVGVGVDDLVGRSRGERHDMECGKSLSRLERKSGRFQAYICWMQHTTELAASSPIEGLGHGVGVDINVWRYSVDYWGNMR